MLARMVHRGMSEEIVVRQVIRNLYRTFKKVAAEIPLEGLLRGVAEGRDLTPLVREARGHDFAKLIEIEAVPGSPELVMERVVWASLDKYLHQIGMKVVGESPAWPDFQTYSDFCKSVRRGIFDDAQELAHRLARSPGTAPSLPRETSVVREERRKQMTGMSLLGGLGGETR